MCRIAAFPPGFARRDALEILRAFAPGNNDGTGTAFVRDGRLVVHKWPVSFWRAERMRLLSHMPHNGWTLCHLRSATHGEVAPRNTHPFVKSGWAIVHNGVWGEHELVRAAIGEHARWQGETDSEVAAQLFAKLGPKEFSRVVTTGGVYVGLHTSGKLWVVKTSGQLEALELEKGKTHVLGSTLPHRKAIAVSDGWLQFDAKGALVSLSARSTKRHLFWGDFVPDKVTTKVTTKAPGSVPRFPIAEEEDDDEDALDQAALEAFMAAEEERDDKRSKSSKAEKSDNELGW